MFAFFFLISFRLCLLEILFRAFVASITDNGLQAPIFLQEPLSRLTFSNDSGSQISCSAHGNPAPAVSWILKDGSSITPIPGLR